MFKFILVAVLLCTSLFVSAEDMIGPGKWKIYHISYMEVFGDEVKIDLTQNKIDRTSYGYSGTIECLEPLDNRYGMRMDICKFVDGGCKQFQVLSDESFTAFIEKFAADNIGSCFSAMKVDPPEFPLPAGKYAIKDFKFDTTTLPQECSYGHFIAETCATKNGKPVGCIEVEVEFIKDEEEEE